MDDCTVVRKHADLRVCAHRYTSLFLLVLMALCQGCALSDAPYRQLAISRGLRHDGWIIGIEQANREDMGAPKKGQHDARFFRPERLPFRQETIQVLRKKPGYDRSEKDWQAIEIQDAALLRNSIFASYADSKKINIVTQVYESFRPRGLDTNRYATVDLFNAHDRSGSGIIGETRFVYEESFVALEVFRRRFREKVKDGEHTHVVLMALGWHVDQVEAIHTYNLMLRNLCDQSRGQFRPLVVGITWPSAWLQGLIQPLDLFGHVLSYFDKAKDADAIGATLVSYLLHDILLEESNPLPVIAIGHSMGARMLSRAYFSGRNLVAMKRHKKLDLLVCLQGAFSANRFLLSDTDEGHPYSTFADKRAQIVLTTSTLDLANAAARILTSFPNVGGQYGLGVAEEHPDIFRILRWNNHSGKGTLPTKDEIFPTGKKKILMIDAESIVRGGAGGLNGKKVGPHNDFVDAEMSRLLWTLIK